MPLRDHFRPPIDDIASWEGFHAQWPAMIVLSLKRRLPRRYLAEPRAHLGALIEIDVATFEKDDPDLSLLSSGSGNGGVATAVWAPSQPTLRVASDLPEQAEYAVRVYDTRRGRRLVAAIEIVSPANKDRPEHREAFVAKCVALLQKRVSVTIIDLVTTRNFNLYSDLLELLGHYDPSLGSKPPPVYAVACRETRPSDGWVFETWFHPLAVGQALPTLPLWLADNLAVPLELEANYEETCRVFDLP